VRARAHLAVISSTGLYIVLRIACSGLSRGVSQSDVSSRAGILKEIVVRIHEIIEIGFSCCAV
jgi:hypothetical protein